MSNEVKNVSKISIHDIVYLLKDEEARQLIADILHRESELQKELDNKLTEINVGEGLKVSEKEAGTQTIELDDSLMIIDGGTAEDVISENDIVWFILDGGTVSDLTVY